MDKLQSPILSRDPLSNHRLQALTLPAALLHQVQVVGTMVQQLIIHLSLVIILNQHITHSPHILQHHLQILMQVVAAQVVVIKHHTPQQLQQQPQQRLQNPFNQHIVEDQVQQWL